jgi:hypothetical protein
MDLLSTARFRAGVSDGLMAAEKSAPRSFSANLTRRCLNGLTADLQRGEYVDPRKSAETFGSVAELWFATKQHRKPKTVAGYRSLLDTVVLPTWADVSLKRIDYESYSTWLRGLSVDGGQRGAGLSASPHHSGAPAGRRCPQVRATYRKSREERSS